jgi:septum formation protein
MAHGSDAPLVLGSGSPRRREILEGLGVPIRVVTADIDESAFPAESADEYIARVTAAKLEAVSRRIGQGDAAPGILVADTIVVVDGDVLGKPTDVDDAERLLSRIVGRTHVVKTRYAIAVRPALGAARTARTIETRVTMRAASATEIRRYAETGEGLDKAGAYAAQGIGTFLIEHVEGSFSNVVGLPACEVVQDLLALGLLEGFPRAVP